MTFFENLLGAVQAGGALVLSPVLRSWYNRWGVTGAEVTQWRQDENITRLLVRQRLYYRPELAWVWRLTELVGFVMEHKVILGIRQRAVENL